MGRGRDAAPPPTLHRTAHWQRVIRPRWPSAKAEKLGLSCFLHNSGLGPTDYRQPMAQNQPRAKLFYQWVEAALPTPPCFPSWPHSHGLLCLGTSPNTWTLSGAPHSSPCLWRRWRRSLRRLGLALCLGPVRRWGEGAASLAKDKPQGGATQPSQLTPPHSQALAGKPLGNTQLCCYMAESL